MGLTVRRTMARAAPAVTEVPTPGEGHRGNAQTNKRPNGCAPARHYHYRVGGVWRAASDIGWFRARFIIGGDHNAIFQRRTS